MGWVTIALTLLTMGGQLISPISGSKLNVPRVLLPYSESPPTFQLLSESGCFRWSSTRPDVVKVTSGQPGDCSASALIQAVSSTGPKASAMIMAEDSDTGLLLRADVIVDSIQSLKMVTKTHELYLEETPEKFEVRAYDEQGNEFSTLKGLRFRWTIEVGGPAIGTEILRFMTWRDSPYNTEPILESLELRGEQGNKVLMEGIKTGSAKVTVRLVDSQHSSVPPSTESLMVVANLFLLPPSARIMPCATLPYRAQQFRSNRLLPVSLPSPNHQLLVPEQLGTLDQSLNTVVGSSQPATGLVELVDQNVAPGEIVKTPTAELSVVTPVTLELYCLPHNSWTSLTGREVSVKVEIFDIDGGIIHPSDNINIKIVVDESRFDISSRLDNGTLTVGVPLLAGPTLFTATLLGVDTCPLSTPISSSSTLEVWPDMSLSPPLTLLPWDPVVQGTQTIKLTVTGGDIPLSWMSDEPSLVTVSQTGVATVTTDRIGESTVTVSMSRASHCQATARLLVVPAVSLSLLESVQEVLVGSVLSLPLELASEQNTFSHCSNLEYNLSHTDMSFTSHTGAPSGEDTGGCATVSVSSISPSFSTLTVTWSYPTLSGDIISLSYMKTVSSYLPLAHVLPSTGHTVLALESGRVIAWEGGPLPWPLSPELHTREVNVGDLDLISVTEGPGHPSLHVYRVDCKGEGETQVTLTVRNRAGPSLTRPVSLQSTITVVCSRPHTISLAANIPRPSDTNLPPCPLQALQGRQAAHHDRNLKVLVTLRDAQNRILDSAENVQVDWTMSGLQLDLGAKEGLLTESLDMEPGPLYQMLIVNSVTGHIDLTATIAREGGLLGPSSHSDILQLNLVEQVKIQPDTIQLFEMDIGEGKSVGGSGYFSVGDGTLGLVKSVYSPTSRLVTVTPISPGLDIIYLLDLCLATPENQLASLSVSVSGLAGLTLGLQDKVQLGDSVIAGVDLLDDNNIPLKSSALQHIDIQLVTVGDDTTLVTIGVDQTVDGSNHAQFNVEGIQLGRTQLEARATYKGSVIASSPSPLTVYPPLVLEPRNISLVIGAVFQFTSIGGPADCKIEFNILDSDVAITTMEGIVTSSTIGVTHLEGRAVSSDGVVYSYDSVSLHVRPLTSVHLVVPTNNLLVGSLVPVTLYGQDMDMNVYSYGSAVPLLNIDWAVTGPGYGDLESPIEGHLIVPPNSGVVMFRAGVVGKSTITATVSISSKLEKTGQFQLDQDQTLTVSTTITVVERLELTNTSPRLYSGGLLLSPQSNYQLSANKGGAVYGLQSQSPSGLGLTVTDKGLVTTGQGTGTAVITARHGQGDRIEEVALSVDVRPVEYILLRATGDDWSATELEILPRGANLKLIVTQHDSWGRQFNSDSQVELLTRPNRFDLTKILPGGENIGPNMATLSQGWTVVRASEKLGSKDGWLVANTGEGVSGVTRLVVGDVADFDNVIEGGGEWTVEPAGLLELDPVSGVGVGLEPGVVRLSYKLSGNTVLTKVVTIRESGDTAVDTKVVLSSSRETVVSLILGGSSSNKVTDLPVGFKPSPVGLFTCSGEIKGFTVKEDWVGDSWVCIFSPVEGAGPGEPEEVTLNVRGGEYKLQYLPPLSVEHYKLEVGIEGGLVRVIGHTDTLSLMEITHSEGLDVGTPQLEGGGVILPLTLSDSHYSQNPTVKLAVPVTGQELTVTILPQVGSCPGQSEEGLITVLLSDLLLYYQSVLSILVAIVLAVYLTVKYLNIKRVPALKPSQPPPTPVKQPTEQSADPTSPYLWSQDQSPIYGSPVFRRSPPSQPRAQYSYN